MEGISVVGPAKRLVPLPQFVVTSEGPLQGSTLVIDGEELALGRREGSQLHLDDPHVSRSHATLHRKEGVIVLEELGSTGGTFVNGQQVHGSQVLRHNDLVRFGTVETRFEDRSSLLESEDETQMIEVAPAEEKPVLSPRQQEVLSFLREGLTNPEIAVKLGVTERTVKAHCQEVFDRLGARNRTAAVAAAMKMDLFDD
jgi:pSer/pThr/pTyr-binding forkhead associated (FHA) protein